MFPRRNRLSRAHFPLPQTPVTRLTSPYFVLSNPSAGEGYAVVVSKKVARRSVDRHRIKRRIIAALQTLPLPAALVVYPRAAATTLSFEATQQQLAALLAKLPLHQQTRPK